MISLTIKTDGSLDQYDDVQKDAAAQLDRLAHFRKSQVPEMTSATDRHSQNTEASKVDNANKSKTTEFAVPIEVLQILRRHVDDNEREESVHQQRIEDVIPAAAYNAIMVERIKRGHSGSFLSGVASKLVGGVASASSSSSSSSSGTAYGAPQSVRTT